MIKKSRFIITLMLAIISYNIGTVSAAPSEIYGYKRLAIWDFHENHYDENEQIRVIPNTVLFDTKGKLKFHKDKIKQKVNNTKHNEISFFKKSKKVDGVSSATNHSSDEKHGKGSEKPDGVSGASHFISANVVYDFDMLSNAIILKNLGVEDESINKIIDNWNSTTRTAITQQGVDLVQGYGIDYDSYINKAVEEYMSGRDLSFEEFTKNNKNKIRNLPYKAKYILEDGNYGDQIIVSEINKMKSLHIKDNIKKINEIRKEAPAIISKDTKKGTDDIELTFQQDKQWENSISKIKKLDISPGMYKELEFKVSEGKIYIKQNEYCFSKNGKFTLRIFADGYKPADVSINLYKEHPEINLKSVPIVGQTFVLGMSRGTFDYDWIDNIKEVYVDEKLLSPNGEYIKAIERLEIKPISVIKSGKHIIRIKSTGFNDVVKQVIYFNEDGTRPQAEVLPKEQMNLKPTPENIYINLTEINAGRAVIINNAFYGDYKVRDISLNGHKLKENKDFNNTILGNIFIEENVINKLGENSIVLHVDGYKDKEFKITVK